MLHGANGEATKMHLRRCAGSDGRDDGREPPLARLHRMPGAPRSMRAGRSTRNSSPRANGNGSRILIGRASGKLTGVTGCGRRGTMADGDDAEREQVLEAALPTPPAPSRRSGWNLPSLRSGQDAGGSSSCTAPARRPRSMTGPTWAGLSGSVAEACVAPRHFRYRKPMRAFKIVGGVDVVGMALLQTSPPSVRMGSARGRGQGHVGLQGARSSRCRKASGNAASALGLHRLRVLHLVVFPQAIHMGLSIDWGIMPLWQGPSLHWNAVQIGDRARHRGCRCRPRNEPGAADQRPLATIASAGTCSCAG